MIVYRELSSLVLDLGFSERALYSVSNSIEKHYHKAKIPKSNGEFRELLIPDDFLKSIQRSIATNLLAYDEISPYATAYRYGGSNKSKCQTTQRSVGDIEAGYSPFLRPYYLSLCERKKCFPRNDIQKLIECFCLFYASIRTPYLRVRQPLPLFLILL